MGGTTQVTGRRRRTNTNKKAVKKAKVASEVLQKNTSSIPLPRKRKHLLARVVTPELESIEAGSRPEKRRRANTKNEAIEDGKVSNEVLQEDTSSIPLPRTGKPLLARVITPELESIEAGSRPVKYDFSKRNLSFDQSVRSVSLISTSTDSLGDEGEIAALCNEKSVNPSVAKSEQKLQCPEKYMKKREMTSFQERINAITVIPGAFYCFLFLLSGTWLDESLKAEVREEMLNSSEPLTVISGCLSTAWLPNLHSLPPLPVIAGALGIILHAPFSFMYHWTYAHSLPPVSRLSHWSRRMDHAMIHVCSAALAYATSGRWDFFAANLLFNMDCVYRHLFQKQIRPRSNQIRVLISVVAYTVPILWRGHTSLFAQVWCVFGISFWLFGMYPIGGWSHAAFHLVVAIIPPLLMSYATTLVTSQDQLKVAAQCAVIATQSLHA